MMANSGRSRTAQGAVAERAVLTDMGLLGCGWGVTAVIGMREAARELVGRDACLPIDSINESKTLVAATTRQLSI